MLDRDSIEKLQIKMQLKNIGSGDTPNQVDGIVVVRLGHDLRPRSGGNAPKVHVDSARIVIVVVIGGVNMQKGTLHEAP